MTQGHTPGPWSFRELRGDDGLGYIEADGHDIMHAGVSDISAEENRANASLIAAREVVCGYHHDKHPESPWHNEQAVLVRSGRFDNMLDVQAAYHGIKRGRELERDA